MAKPNLIPSGSTIVPPEIRAQEVVLLDETNPRSLVNIVPQTFKDAIINIAENFPHYLTETEVELQALVKPTELDDRMRVAFWHEYVRAQDAGQNIKLMNVFSPFCTDKHFYTKITTNPGKIAWLICKPSEYMMSLEASLNHGKNTLDKIMKMDVFTPDGNLKIKEAGVFLKAYELLDNRVRGAVIQRIEQKTHSLHMHTKTPDMDGEALRDELEVLRKKQGAIDVHVTDITVTARDE